MDVKLKCSLRSVCAMNYCCLIFLMNIIVLLSINIAYCSLVIPMLVLVGFCLLLNLSLSFNYYWYMLVVKCLNE